MLHAGKVKKNYSSAFAFWIDFAVYLLLGDSDTCILYIKQSEMNAIPCSLYQL
jgi:hypothetical protein